MIVSADTLNLADYAERAYLEYAMSVVKGRALPAVQDGQKPVQRRILFAMKDMGLAHGAKPVKSARVVGEILGKYHPHGDSSAYEAMVRMAQDFTLRYPLIDGIGNFGSRDGDGAAAMRYTEARLTPIAELLLSEINQGTVDFVPNYDGAFDEPVSLPARLPVVLLNGASGIAVGMATEIPSHNLNEVTQAAIALLKKPNLEVADLMQYCPAPDFAGGGHIITSAKDLQNIYQSGKGSVRVRARYEIDKMARGQWRVIVSELPPNTSAAKILAEIEEQTNPKPKAGKKQLNQDQLNTKKLMLDLIEKVRDESDSEHPLRLVFEPKSSRVEPEHFINTLMAQTSLEGNVSINLVMMGMDNRPAQKNLKTILQEWLDYRVATVTRRLQHRLDAVEKRIHILEGRMIAFLHIDEIIKVIRESDEPKADLIAKFNLTEIQAEDILEIRLRQLARLEGIKLESELNELRDEQSSLQHLLADENDKKKLIIKEMQADAKQFGDERRTLVEAAERATLTQTTADEPITLILSQKGWIRARAGHDVDLSQIAFKEGDDLQQVLETRTVQPVIVLDTLGRSYTIDPADVPKGRGDGVPVGSLIDIQAAASVLTMIAGSVDEHYLLANSGGYGFICKLEDLHSRLKAGKTIMTLESGEVALLPEKVYLSSLINPDCKIVLATAQNRLLAFPIGEMKIMAKGRGLQLISLQDDDKLVLMKMVNTPDYTLEIVGKRSGVSHETLHVSDIANKRGRKGKILDIAGSLQRII
ncbi:DNA topoisomerase IV subunit A [Kingella kingae]|uniref:DNA topoisomerase IV subunit A n=1 Tax=Kingella kingae TaxID=504 RepID=UPI000258553C|nr:DNA topoisomerase IV subunit A [Kingella kingae]EIC13842.1 DNA topoisomerase IV subunit A [Kingella kingae PYKK081]MDK4568660.1 DNA topoisomerase IV subunit A [Kingella kingae]MDK4570571.1 DNA topoisomerase IV subunit A [Kingella kingae]MDK4572473.1 DNA topoisomerase IV subunit A [Kingella kingae]MDK4598681.1 DNA topoisomerase IV subunit A [Kingella kingae]